MATNKQEERGLIVNLLSDVSAKSANRKRAIVFFLILLLIGIVEMVSDPTTKSISHKRVIAFGSFLVLVSFSVMEYFKPPISLPLLSVLAGLCGGQSVLSLFERRNIKEKDKDNY